MKGERRLFKMLGEGYLDCGGHLSSLIDDTRLSGTRPYVHLHQRSTNEFGPCCPRSCTRMFGSFSLGIQHSGGVYYSHVDVSRKTPTMWLPYVLDVKYSFDTGIFFNRCSKCNLVFQIPRVCVCLRYDILKF